MALVTGKARASLKSRRVSTLDALLQREPKQCVVTLALVMRATDRDAHTAARPSSPPRSTGAQAPGAAAARFLANVAAFPGAATRGRRPAARSAGRRDQPVALARAA